MKVYIDLIILINFIFDFIILISTSLILKRNIKIYKIILGAITGSLTILILFIRMSQIQLLIFKFIVSILMILVTFKYKNIKYFFKNLYHLYLISIILGGFLTFIDNLNLSINRNIILSIILVILLVISYIKQIKELKTNYNKYYKIDIYLNNKSITLNAFLDTGNKLIDPYKGYPIIIVNEDKIKEEYNYIYVPYNTISSSGILKCIKPKKIYIENVGYKNKFLVGLIKNINIDGVDCILNEKLLEG